MDNQAPVPKPRTKFTQDATKDETIDNEINESLENAPSPSPSLVQPHPKPTPPALPPRPPPPKPPRAAELGLNDLVPSSPPYANNTPTPPPSMSPPSRQAPPPPPPRPTPPDVGWKPEIIEEARVQHIMSRPLPATPLEVSVSVENPMYLSLDKLREISGITPSSDDVCEWLSEEDEANKPSTSTAIPVEVRHSEIEDNPYTPCPRRNDFPSSSTSSRQSHNLYVSPDEIFSDSFKQKAVIESCSSSNSDLAPSTHPYVNISKNESSSSLDEKEADVKIDGSTVTFSGFVSISSFRKDKRVHCRLRNMQISFHEDEETGEFYQGPFDIKDCYTFRIVRKKENSHFMDIASTSSPQPPPPPISCIQLFYGEKRHNSITFCPEDAASLWMLLLSEAWLSTLHGVLLSEHLKNAQDLSIFGNVWVREGTTGEWTPAAAGVYDNKTFCYGMTDEKHRVKRRASALLDEINEVDLRKSSRVQEKVDKSQFCPNLKHRRGPFSISLNNDDSALFRAYFIDSKDDSSTSAWFETIDELLKRPASRLEDYRLTSDDIPVIVDKCLRFVDAYGVKSEGIYRRNGKVSEAKTILTKLIEDPVGYHIKSENNETVYAVADVLRQFFRKLDLPLILCEVQSKLFEISKIDTPTPEDLEEYSRIIGELPPVHQSTLKKCIAHLKNVHDHMEDNKASVENLAKIFGASLFSTDTMPQPCFTENYNDQINVIRHFIKHYDLIFHISSQEEISRQLIKEAEKKTRNNQKFGAELMVPIHMWEKDNLPFNVKVGLAGEEVCREAIAKPSFDAPRNSSYSVFEVLGEGQLLRRVAASEKLSKIVMRWIGWKCTNGFLLFDHDKYRFDGNDMSSFTGKVKMAEPGSKTFKSYEMKIEKGVSILVYRNDKLYKTWLLDDIDWFVGAETTRKAPNHFNTTMLNSDGYCSRLPGYCISFKEEDERTRWLNAVNYAKTGGQPESLVFI